MLYAIAFLGGIDFILACQVVYAFATIQNKRTHQTNILNKMMAMVLISGAIAIMVTIASR